MASGLKECLYEYYKKQGFKLTVRVSNMAFNDVKISDVKTDGVPGIILKPILPTSFKEHFVPFDSIMSVSVHN